MVYNVLRVLVCWCCWNVQRAHRCLRTQLSESCHFSAYHQLFQTRAKTVILCFRLRSNIPSASHSGSLAGASLESPPKVSENSSWRNSFHAMWVERLRPGDTFCQPPNAKYAGPLFVCDWDRISFFFFFSTSDIHSVGLGAFGPWHYFYISTSICHHSGFKINPMSLEEMEEWAFRFLLREPFCCCRQWGGNLNAGWFEGCRQTIGGWQVWRTVFVSGILYFPPAFSQEWDLN